MEYSSQTEKSLLVLATMLLAHCRTYRLLPDSEEKLDRMELLNAASDATCLFEEVIEELSLKKRTRK